MLKKSKEEKKFLALARKANIKPDISDKIFKFKGVEFRIKKPITFEMEDAYEEILGHRTFLERIYTEGINLSKVRVYQERISKLQNGLNSFRPEFIETNKNKYELLVKDLNNKIAEVNTEFENDYEAYSNQIYYMQRQTDAFKKWLRSVNIMKPFFKLILDGDFNKIDWNDLAVGDFIVSIIAGFGDRLKDEKKKLIS